MSSYGIAKADGCTNCTPISEAVVNSVELVCGILLVARNTCVFAGVFVRCVVCALVFVSWLLPWSALCSFGVALSCGMLCLVNLSLVVFLFVS